MTDLPALVAHANNWNIAKNLTNGFPHPYHPEHGEVFINLAMQGNPVNIFAIEVEGNAAGAIGIHPQTDIHEKNAELGYWLAEPYWGQGIMTRAVRQMVDYAFQTFPVNRIFARPFGTNLASQRVLIKAGFTLEGSFAKTIWKKGEFIDELIYAVRKPLS